MTGVFWSKYGKLSLRVPQKWIPKFATSMSKKGSPTANANEQFEQERSKPEKILTRNEYERIREKTPDAIAWAPGLIGGQHFEKADFPGYVDKMVANL